MPLDASVVGFPFATLTVVCDARWLMAYAAGVPDVRPALYDTTSALVTHPMFSVAPEWELLISRDARSSVLTSTELARGVHAVHDVIRERSIVAGESIVITATLTGVDRRHSGATQQVLFEAADVHGRIVWRTLMTSVFRGVILDGDPKFAECDWPELATGSSLADTVVAERVSWVSPIDAHVYSECARIWNPIHTDIAFARSAGLDNPILHGTATMARAVSIATELAGVELADVARVAGRFAAMVDLGSSIKVRVLDIVGPAVHFDVLNHRGERAIRDGFLVVRT